HLVGDIHQPLHVGAKYFDKTCQTSVDPNIGGTPPTFGIGNTSAMTMGGNLIFLVAPPPAVPPASPRPSPPPAAAPGRPRSIRRTRTGQKRGRASSSPGRAFALRRCSRRSSSRDGAARLPAC